MTTETNRHTSGKTALFDFDGVVADTEPIYDQYWEEAAERYGLGIPHFNQVIKGTTLPYIIEHYFAERPKDFQEMVIRESNAFDHTMPMPPVRGALEFLRTLKRQGVKTGLVTSSDDIKVKRAFELLRLDGLFDTIVTADRISEGKPNPMCYLLAAQDLQEDPAHCIVFEDSFNGIKAGTAAGMRVIGLSTTNPAEQLRPLVHEVIPHFEELTFAHYLTW